MKKKRHILTSITIAIAAVVAYASSPQGYLEYAGIPYDVAKALGWVPSNDEYNLCHGYFYENPYFKKFPNPPNPRTEALNIESPGAVVLSEQGTSYLNNGVILTQPGRRLTSNQGRLYRDKKTHKINAIQLQGNVRLIQHNERLVGTKAYVDLKTHNTTVYHAAYHVQAINPKSHKPINAWGVAQKARSVDNYLYIFEHATYSTCTPAQPCWYLQARSLVLNKKTGKAKAKDVIFRLHGVPIFYTPYISFTTKAQRKTGFLNPAISFSNNNGTALHFPFYWNMAPNYDMTITPIYYSKRGVQANAAFRYLTENSIGNLFFSYLYHDKAFQQFINNTLANPPNVGIDATPYLNQLRNTSTNRRFFSLNDSFNINPRLQSTLNLNYASDDYYLQDFGSTVNAISANQLLNQWDLNYNGWHWQDLLRVQVYQTLHPINQITQPAEDQYQRLPQFDANGYYANFAKHTDLLFSGQAINFNYHSDFLPQLPIGQRYHVRPGLSFPFYYASGSITPQIYIDTTSYSASDLLPNQQGNITRNLPIADVDSNLYFDRMFNWGHRAYRQTFQPELFYLYVPYQNQNNIPNFDTQLLPFSYDQLFALNRFTGFDRIQNANQFSLGLSSYIYDATSGNPIFAAKVGSTYYLSQPRVCLNAGCEPTTERTSPIIGELDYSPYYNWTTSATYAWDPTLHQTNNGGVNITYGRDDNHIFTTGLQYIHNGDQTSTPFLLPSTINYYRTQTGFAWPLTPKWEALGFWYYNLSQHRSESYFGGLEYNTCCWAFRVVASRSYIGDTIEGNLLHSQYKTTYYLQLELKGLGTFANNNPRDILTAALPGYRDMF